MVRYLFIVALFTALVALTRQNHASFGLATLASAVFLICADVGERMTQMESTRLLTRMASFLGMAGLLGAASALLISVAYDWIVGPDPLRFSLAENIAMDFAVVAALMGLLRAARWILRSRRSVDHQ